MKLELLSSNLILILQELLKNQNLVKYLYYNTTNPISGSTVSNTNSLMFNKVFPFPFDQNVTTEDVSHLRVYYTNGDLEKVAVENIRINFDIIVAKNLWLINSGTAQIRPYEIMYQIIESLWDKSISTVGKLRFDRFQHLYVNERFDALQMVAELVVFGKGSR